MILTSCFRLPWCLASLTVAFALSCGGGDDEADTPVTCEMACGRTINCPADPDPECVPGCKAFESVCPAQMQALNKCVYNTPSDKLYCDEQQQTNVVAGVCDNELMALSTCGAASTP